MLINCVGCGVSISTRKGKCPYCKSDNMEVIEMLTGIRNEGEKYEVMEKLKGTILSFVHR